MYVCMYVHRIMDDVVYCSQCYKKRINQTKKASFFVEFSLWLPVSEELCTWKA